MAALALMTAACSNEDDDLMTQQPQQPEGITITAQLAPKTGGADTRAVSEGTNNIVAEWAVNEHLAILYEVNGTKYEADAEIIDVDETGVATIEFTVQNGTADDTPYTLVYPRSAAKDDHTGVKDFSSLLANQDGTLNANLDVRVGTGTIKIATPGLTFTTQPEAQFAIFKFTLDGVNIDSDHPLLIHYFNTDNTTSAVTKVTPTSSTNSVYVAMPPVESRMHIFTVDNVDNNNNRYFKSGRATIVAGKYYETTLKMSLRYPLTSCKSVRAFDLGCVIASNGYVYLNDAAATAAGQTSLAMVACTRTSPMLAIELNSTPGHGWYSDATAYAETLNTTKAVSDCTWIIPNLDNWENMFSACSPTPLVAMTAATGITIPGDAYWCGNSNPYYYYTFIAESTYGYYRETLAEAYYQFPFLACLTFKM